VLYYLGVLQLDPWLEPHRDVLKHRYSLVEKWAKAINDSEGGLDKFSKVGLNSPVPSAIN
jgi:1,4-alpha-glucan branching enzyme